MARGGLLKTHRWLALVAILPLTVLLLSGAGLSFVHEFDRAMHPRLLSVSATKALDMNTLQSIVADELITLDANLMEIVYPETVYDPIRLHMHDGSKQWRRYLNPHTGKVLGDRSVESEWSEQLLKLHTGLLNLQFGSLLTLFGTIVLLLMLSLGLSLLRQASTWRVTGWHAWLGLCSSPVLVLIIVSGLLSISGVFNMSNENSFDAGGQGSLKKVLTNREADINTLCQQRPAQLRLNLDNTAQLRCLDGSLWLLQSDQAVAPLQHESSQDTLVWELHSGEWAGLPGRAFWMWSVLAVLYLFFSGIRDWVVKVRGSGA